ncbi:apoptotic protease-activating factor 1-like isoform X2 [Dysidea avara]|uniref:apoptotic protease-activating factor 1-like isoform X2 n=1 Tax=Dysidea avara TaxID=196820 RepID=UPI00331907D8
MQFLYNAHQIYASMATGLKESFIRNHVLIVHSLDAELVLPYLQSHEVITPLDTEVVDSQKTKNAKCSKILLIVYKKAIADPSVYQKFIDALRDAEGLYGDRVGYIADALMTVPMEPPSPPDWSTALSEEQRYLWLHHRHVIAESLDVSAVIDWLIGEGVVDHVQAEEIMEADTMVKRARQLLKVVTSKGAAGYVKFREALDHHGYSSLASYLLGSHDDSSQEVTKVEEVLKTGQVPPLVRSTHVYRPEASTLVQQLLQGLHNTDGWVVLYGIAGCGKSVLASEALRDAKLLREVFPGGVYWVDMGEGDALSSDMDESELLVKMQNLILRLDKARYQPPNLRAAQSYLQNVIMEQHPKCLLVLDNLWRADVAKYFSVRCRVLATTRNASVAQSVSTPSKASLDVSNMFTEEQLRLLLAKWVQKSLDELPVHADIIVQLSNGSPLVISLIGALLRTNPTDARWVQCMEKLRSRRLSIALRRPPMGWQYRNMTLLSSIELSISALDQELREYFYHLVVLDNNVAITSEALAVVWDTDEMDAEAIMLQLADQSLAYARPPSGNDGYFSFLVHDIIIIYLRDTTQEEATRDYHKKLVDRYRAQCNRDFPLVKPDGYVHQQLLYHLEMAGDHVTRSLLLSDLRWLRVCLAHCAPSVVLRWYIRECIGDACSRAGLFQRFVSRNMDKLVLDHNVDDVIQLALLLPDTSDIYKQAMEIAKAEKLFSLCWCNKTSSESEQSLLLSSQIHNGYVFHAEFSHDSQKVVSCSSEMELKVWQHTTGSVIHDLNGHEDHVTHCVMSSSGKYLVSCSEDCSVKVWDAERGKHLADCDGHLVGVQCCHVSPDESQIVSCDVASTIILWSLEQQELLCKWNHQHLVDAPSPESVGVKYCCFLGDGKTLATCATDGSIKIWTNQGKNITSLTDHTKQITCLNSRDHMICSGSIDHTTRLWDTRDYKCVGVLQCSSSVEACHFSIHGNHVITGEQSGSVKLWNTSDGSLLSLVTTHASAVLCVGYSPDNEMLLSTNDMGVVKIHKNEWKSGDVTKVQEEPMKFYRRFAAHFSYQATNDQYEPIMACCDMKDNKLKLLHGKDASLLRVLSTPSNPRSWQFSPDGTRIVIGCIAGELLMVATETGDPLWTVQSAHPDRITRCVFSLDGLRVVTVSPGQHKVWWTNSGHVISSHEGISQGVRVCHFLLDHVSLLSAQENGSVQLWNTDTGETIRTYQFGNHDNGGLVILCINVSPDDQLLAATTTSGSGHQNLAVVWRVSDGKEVKLLPPYKRCARVCAVNNKFLCVGYDDGSLQCVVTPDKVQRFVKEFLLIRFYQSFLLFGT